MGAFVLIHGAMHGGWCWAQVAVQLRSRGYEVWTPTLSGQGEYAHTLNEGMTVNTHLEDVERFFELNNISSATLVLHSYAGIMAGPLAQRLTGRITSIAVLGGFLAEPGECLLDVEPVAIAESYRESARSHGGWRLPPAEVFLERWGITDPDLAAYVWPRLVDFSLHFQDSPVHFDPNAFAQIKCTYIEHVNPSMPSLDFSVARARAWGWTAVPISTGHDMMLTMPETTAELLMRAR